jgi:hypothetical protein
VVNALRLAFAIAATTAVGFGIHVLYGQGWAQSYVAEAARAGRLNGVLHPPYPTSIVILAGVTALLPTTGRVLVFLLLRAHLPGSTRWQKGLSFGVLLLLATDAALRFPVMNIATGNPVDVVLVQGAESWAIDLLTGLLIGILTPATFRVVLGPRDAKSQGATT